MYIYSYKVYRNKIYIDYTHSYIVYKIKLYREYTYCPSAKRELAPRLEAKVSFIYPRGRPRAAPRVLNRVRIGSVAPRRSSKPLLQLRL